MTEAEFLFIHDNVNGNINAPDTININIREDENDSLRGIITGLTVTVSDHTNEDLTTVLQQAEKIELTLEYFGGQGTISEINQSTITLDIISADRRNGYTGLYPYFYFRVNETTIYPINAIGVDYVFIPKRLASSFDVSNPHLSTVSFTPVLSEVKFLNDDYNPLISNASENRKSGYLQVADRNQLTANPSNLDKILSQTAELAQIPDSNYSDTGIINSRYVGSVTTAQNYGGVEPALVGSSFKGSIFSKQLSYGEITSSALDGNAVIQDLFHTGPTKLPEFRVVSSSLRFTTNLGTSNTAGYAVRPGAITGSLNFDVGTILELEDLDQAVPNRERVRIANNNTTSKVFTFERGYEGSQREDGLTTGDKIDRVVSTRIFKFDERGTRLIAADNAKIYIPDNNLVLETDRFGIVYTGSVQSS